MSKRLTPPHHRSNGRLHLRGLLPGVLCVLLLGVLTLGMPCQRLRAASLPEEGSVTAVYGATPPPVVMFPGGVLYVEVTDFDGWLNLQIKKGFLNNDPFVKTYWLANSTVLEDGKPLRNSDLMDKGRWGETDQATRGEYNLFVRRQLANLRLVIDDQRLESLVPTKIDRLERPDRTLHELLYQLDRTDQNRAEWQPLLRDFKFPHAAKLTLGLKLEEGPWLYLPSVIAPAPAGKVSPLILQMVSTWSFLCALGLILLGMWRFVVLVGPTDLLRDVDAPLRISSRPQNPAAPPVMCHPFSLARCQMAFWFFLVAAAYLFIWLTTDRVDGINEQVLGLVGISAGTALGVAFISGGKGPNRPMAEEATRQNDPTLNPAVREAAANRYQRLSDQQDRLETATPFGRALDDLLTEDGAISFHRFQMVAWTLVLGLIFVIHFLENYSLPEFSGTTLALMGISSGTYLGFKLP